MKRIIADIFVFMVLVVSACGASAQTTGYGKYRGVWANASSEVLITDSLMMYFTKDISTGNGYASLNVPTRDIAVGVTFTKDSVLYDDAREYSLTLAADGSLVVNGDSLKKVENVDIVKPYDMPYAMNREQIGRCLQEWQLGTFVYNGDDYVHAMVGTNRNSFMFAVNGNMVYLRAAALLQCNDGSLFIQNIRMMKNNNTGEFSNVHVDDNFAFLTNLPEIDRSKFSPDHCVFADNAQIYWSYISNTSDEIKLNGCGETYTYKRLAKDDPMIMEWIKYEK